MITIPPALIMIICGLLIPALSKRGRDALVIGAPILTLLQVWALNQNGGLEISIGGFDLSLIYFHSFSLIFATIFSLAALAAGVFGINQARRTELGAAYVYAGAAIGVTLSGDLISLFVFWEIMAIASTVVIWTGKKPNTGSAGLRYAYTHFVGGVILLIGICYYMAGGESAMISKFTFGDELSTAHILILIGLLINAAAPPFSGWLPDAYPASSPFGAVFLSAFTTKTAVFVLLTLYAGLNILIYVGLVMIFYGIIYAMLENNIRRILSYSIINQVGFMIVGIGIGTPLALAGTAAHAFCHIIYKALLFMSAGSVIFMTGRRKCTDLGGLYHSMRITTACGIVGALAISAFPLTSGFVSKSLISTAAAEPSLSYVWFMLYAASAGVFLHAGIKFPWFVFFHRDSGLRPEDPPKNMRIGMYLMVIGCFAPALFPDMFYKLLPYTVDYKPYKGTYVIHQLQLLLFSGLSFFVMLPYLKRTLTISLDFDWIYRVLVIKVLLFLEKGFYGLISVRDELWNAVWAKLYSNIEKVHGVRGIAAKSWGIAATTLAMSALLGIVLIIYYVGK